MTELQKSLATLIVTLLLCLLVAEVACRWLPVKNGIEAQAVDTDHPVIRFTPNRAFVFSNGWRLTNVNRGHINNEGFINDQDYDPADARPLLAVIGDSFIEAAMVPYRLTVQGSLAADQPASRRVYSFAASGASLLDYSYYAAYAHQRFHPDWLIINVVGNDFDEMLLRYKQLKAYHYLQERPDGSLVPILLEYRPAVGRTLLRQSALARYLIFNLGITAPRITRWLHGDLASLAAPVRAAYAAEGLPAYVGNTAALAEAQRVELSRRATDYVLDTLPRVAGVEPSHVLFLIDSFRDYDPIRLPLLNTSFFGAMRTYFMSAARQRGYEVQDLEDWFTRRHARDGAVFQFPDDAHWNANGHEEAANAVRASTVYARFTEH